MSNSITGSPEKIAFIPVWARDLPVITGDQNEPPCALDSGDLRKILNHDWRNCTPCYIAHYQEIFGEDGLYPVSDNDIEEKEKNSERKKTENLLEESDDNKWGSEAKPEKLFASANLQATGKAQKEKRHHRRKNVTIQRMADASPEEHLTCKQCKAIFGGEHCLDKLRAHISTVHVSYFPYQCQYCELVVSTEYEIEIHQNKDHPHREISMFYRPRDEKQKQVSDAVTDSIEAMQVTNNQSSEMAENQQQQQEHTVVGTSGDPKDELEISSSTDKVAEEPKLETTAHEADGDLQKLEIRGACEILTEEEEKKEKDVANSEILTKDKQRNEPEIRENGEAVSPEEQQIEPTTTEINGKSVAEEEIETVEGNELLVEKDQEFETAADESDRVVNEEKQPKVATKAMESQTLATEEQKIETREAAETVARSDEVAASENGQTVAREEEKVGIKGIGMPVVEEEQIVKKTESENTETVAEEQNIDTTTSEEGESTASREDKVVAVATETGVGEEEKMDAVATETAVAEEEKVDAVATETAVGEEEKVDAVTTETGVGEEEKMDAVTTETAVGDKEKMDAVATETAVGEEEKMATLDSNSAETVEGDERKMDVVASNNGETVVRDEEKIDATASNTGETTVGHEERMDASASNTNQAVGDEDQKAKEVKQSHPTTKKAATVVGNICSPSKQQAEDSEIQIGDLPETPRYPKRTANKTTAAAEVPSDVKKPKGKAKKVRSEPEASADVDSWPLPRGTKVDMFDDGRWWVGEVKRWDKDQRKMFFTWKSTMGGKAYYNRQGYDYDERLFRLHNPEKPDSPEKIFTQKRGAASRSGRPTVKPSPEELRKHTLFNNYAKAQTSLHVVRFQCKWWTIIQNDWTCARMLLRNGSVDKDICVSYEDIVDLLDCVWSPCASGAGPRGECETYVDVTDLSGLELSESEEVEDDYERENAIKEIKALLAKGRGSWFQNEEGDSDSAAVSSPKVNVSGSVAPLTLISPLRPESPSACAIHEVDDSPTGGSSSAVAIPEVEDSATGGSSSAVAAQMDSLEAPFSDANDQLTSTAEDKEESLSSEDSSVSAPPRKRVKQEIEVEKAQEMEMDNEEAMDDFEKNQKTSVGKREKQLTPAQRKQKHAQDLRLKAAADKVANKDNDRVKKGLKKFSRQEAFNETNALLKTAEDRKELQKRWAAGHKALAPPAETVPFEADATDWHLLMECVRLVSVDYQAQRNERNALPDLVSSSVTKSVNKFAETGLVGAIEAQIPAIVENALIKAFSQPAVENKLLESVTKVCQQKFGCAETAILVPGGNRTASAGTVGGSDMCSAENAILSLTSNQSSATGSAEPILQMQPILFANHDGKANLVSFAVSGAPHPEVQQDPAADTRRSTPLSFDHGAGPGALYSFETPSDSGVGPGLKTLESTVSFSPETSGRNSSAGPAAALEWLATQEADESSRNRPVASGSRKSQLSCKGPKDSMAQTERRKALSATPPFTVASTPIQSRFEGQVESNKGRSFGNLNTEALDDESGDDAYGGDDDYLDIEEVEESEVSLPGRKRKKESTGEKLEARLNKIKRFKRAPTPRVIQLEANKLDGRYKPLTEEDARCLRGKPIPPKPNSYEYQTNWKHLEINKMTMNIMVPTTKHHEYMANEGMLYTPFENATPIEMKDICIFISQERVDNACANSKIKIRKPRSARDTEAEDCRFICDLVKSKVKDCGLGVLGVEAAGVGFSDRQNNLRLLWHTNPQYVTEAFRILLCLRNRQMPGPMLTGQLKLYVNALFQKLNKTLWNIGRPLHGGNYSRNKDRDRYRVEVAIRKLGRNLNSGDRIPLTKAELKRYDPTPDDEEGDSNEEASDPEDSDHNQDFDQGSQSVGDAGSRNSSKCDSVKDQQAGNSAGVGDQKFEASFARMKELAMKHRELGGQSGTVDKLPAHEQREYEALMQEFLCQVPPS